MQKLLVSVNPLQYCWIKTFDEKETLFLCTENNKTYNLVVYNSLFWYLNMFAV